MEKKASLIPVLSQYEDEKMGTPVNAPLPRKRVKVPSLWQWLAIIIILGVVIVAVVSSLAGYWIRNVILSATQAPTPVPVTTLNVQRTAPYAGLAITVVSAQYATSFADDDIRPGQALVRLNLQVTNPGADQVKIAYYDSTRLLAPQLNALMPTNLSLSAGPAPGKSERGWIDFAVSRPVHLDTLTLQFGSTTLQETLVNIPLKGAFDAGRYADKISPQAALLTYHYFEFQKDHGYYIDRVLNYHLVKVERRFAYQGHQASQGQQFYVFDFAVDNTSGKDVTPDTSFTYSRLVLNGYNQPPVYTTLPDSFKANATGVSGSVVFSGPAGMNSFTLGFIPKNGNGLESYHVDI